MEPPAELRDLLLYLQLLLLVDVLQGFKSVSGMGGAPQRALVTYAYTALCAEYTQLLVVLLTSKQTEIKVLK